MHAKELVGTPGRAGPPRGSSRRRPNTPPSSSPQPSRPPVPALASGRAGPPPRRLVRGMQGMRRGRRRTGRRGAVETAAAAAGARRGRAAYIWLARVPACWCRACGWIECGAVRVWLERCSQQTQSNGCCAGDFRIESLTKSDRLGLTPAHQNQGRSIADWMFTDAETHRHHIKQDSEALLAVLRSVSACYTFDREYPATHDDDDDDEARGSGPQPAAAAVAAPGPLRLGRRGLCARRVVVAASPHGLASDAAASIRKVRALCKPVAGDAGY